MIDVPKKWQMKQPEQPYDFIKQFPFATLVSQNFDASHLPLVLDYDKGEKGVLYGHFARSNHHWKEADKSPVLAIFNEPHAYISPTWYANKPAVPTWNYAVVHVEGRLNLLSTDATLACLEQMLLTFEPKLTRNKSIIPDEYRDKLATAIVGFEIIIERIVGKQKLGQHRSPDDQRGVASQLKQSSRLQDQILYQYMKDINVGLGEC